MSVNRFYRRFVTEIARESTSMAPKGTLQLKDLYVGNTCGKLLKPWVMPLESTSANAKIYCVSTPGHGYRCEF
jgi:hypothetical protein